MDGVKISFTVANALRNADMQTRDTLMRAMLEYAETGAVPESVDPTDTERVVWPLLKAEVDQQKEEAEEAAKRNKMAEAAAGAMLRVLATGDQKADAENAAHYIHVCGELSAEQLYGPQETEDGQEDEEALRKRNAMQEVVKQTYDKLTELGCDHTEMLYCAGRFAKMTGVHDAILLSSDENESGNA